MKKRNIVLAMVLTLVMVSGVVCFPGFAAGNEQTYTIDADFNEGVKINLSSNVPDQLQLDDTTKAFNYIWVAVSTKGTVVKIDTDTGKVLGEYRTAPEGQPTDPSRTTVDLNGNVWVANRAGNSITRISLLENGQWIDKNGNGKCDTSTGLGDVRPWSNMSGVDTNGGVSTAEDECIITYTKVSSSGTRHVSVDKNNDVWVSGLGSRVFDLVDGKTGLVKRTEGPVGYGAYGGLIDKNGVIWSANPMLRWDTSKPLSGSNGTNWTGYGHPSYGMAIDSEGNVWNTSYGDGNIRKFAPDGTLVGTYNQGFSYAQGCVADKNGDIWIAHSLSGSTVGHMKNDGTYVGTVSVGNGPTGVAVDGEGKVWVTNYNSRNVMRIDPNAGPFGPDGKTHIGAVDYTSPDLGGNLYNYSDMTGSTLTGAPEFGSWTVIRDSGKENSPWGKISWNSKEPDGSSITVNVRSSNDQNNWSTWETVSNGDVLKSTPDGRYLQTQVIFKRAAGMQSPVLNDLTIAGRNLAPVLDPIGDKKTDEGQLLTFTLNAIDPDDNELTYSAINLPAGAVFDGKTGTFNWTPTYDQAGIYPDVHFEVTDGNLTDSEDIKITIANVNRPPELAAIGNKTVKENSLLQFTVTATDPDGDPVKLSAANLPTGAIFNSDTGVFSWTPDYNQAGTYSNIYFEATDGILNDTEEISISVTDVNRPPVVINAKPSIGALWPPNHKLVDVKILGITDPDGDSVKIKITKITSDEPTASIDGAGGNDSAPDAFGIGTNTASLRAERSGKGNGRVYEITFAAIDAKGGEAIGTVKVGVPHDMDGKPAVDDGQLYDATKMN